MNGSHRVSREHTLSEVGVAATLAYDPGAFTVVTIWQRVSGRHTRSEAQYSSTNWEKLVAPASESVVPIAV